MFRWAEQSSGRFQTLDPEEYKRSKPMSERNYESLYWEAQSHIDELEGENAALKDEEEKERHKESARDALLTTEKQ